MKPRWNILYRGPLSSCNYACGYCPFAKTRNSIEELRDDARRLGSFVDWIEAQAQREIGVLFTPWGEALIHRTYQQALLRLGGMPHVRRAAIQTNLACGLKWLDAADRERVALWCTYHPTETTVERFAAKIRILDRMGIRHSVGAVGVKEHFPQIERLREHAARLSRLPHVGAVRQCGLLAGFDLVADRATGAAYPWQERRGMRASLAARKHAALVRPLGDVVVIMPPLCVSEPELDQLVAAAEAGIRAGGD
jgi:hypothetical protein